MKKEYIVDCKITGTVSLFIQAESEEEAITKANDNDYAYTEFGEWNIDQVLGARENK